MNKSVKQEISKKKYSVIRNVIGVLNIVWYLSLSDYFVAMTHVTDVMTIIIVLTRDTRYKTESFRPLGSYFKIHHMKAEWLFAGGSTFLRNVWKLLQE
jgi:uncharacterized membrane protein YccF (DUF307 family)